MSIQAENIEIAVSSKAEDARTSIVRLTTALKKLSKACKGGAGLEEITESLSTITGQFNNISETVEKSKNGISGFSNELSKVTGIVDTMSDAQKELNDSLSNTENAINDVTKKAKEVKNFAQSFDGFFASLRKNKKMVKETFDAFFGTALKGIANIKKQVRYRILRSIISTIGKELQGGLENVYMFSKAMNGEFFGKMDSLKTSTEQLKNQIGSVFSELLITAIPALTTIIEKARQFVDVMSQVFAVMNGDRIYKHAKTVATSWKDASDAAKAYKSQVLGIDELNILSKDNGSGGGSNTPNYEDMFEYKNVDLGKWQSKIEWIKNNVATIATAVTGVLLALKAAKISKPLMDLVNKISGKEISALAQLKTMSGVLFSIAGFSFEFAGAMDIGKNGKNIKNILTTIIGGAVGVGGAALAFGAASLWVTIPLAIALPIIGYEIGLNKKADEEYAVSAFKKRIDELSEKIAEHAAITSEIRFNIKARDEDFSAMEKDIEKVKNLLKEIFTLNEKENQSAAELELLKSLVREINDMGIDGLHLDLDKDNKLVQTREELDAIVEDLLITKLQDKALENLANIWYDQQLAVENTKDTMSDLVTAQKEMLIAVDELKKAQDAYDDAMSKSSYNLGDQIALWLGLGDANKELKTKVREAKDAVKDATKVLDEAQKKYSSNKDELTELNEQYDKYSEIAQNAKEYTKNSVKPLEDTRTAFAELEEQIAKMNAELERYANLIGNVSGAKFRSGFSSGGIVGNNYADGGIVHGQLFIANEGSSPEMIGSWGSQSAVANSDQIVQGIQEGVSSAVSGILAPYLAQIANNTRETANKDFSVNIGDRDIARANQRGQRAMGMTLISTI